jgi:hypothetical protein
MTQDDIIRMAREAGIDEPESDWMYWAAMERFAALVAAAEREACAKLVENFERNGNWITKEEAAKAIRARGEA